MRQPTSKLEKRVAAWLRKEGKEYSNKEQGIYDDLVYGGCASGIVGYLCYYVDTVKFYKRYRNEISKLLYEVLKSTGCSVSELFGDSWNEEDPLALDYYNQNVLAWFGFEETARRLMENEDGDN